jgi:hypothetical protein
MTNAPTLTATGGTGGTRGTGVGTGAAGTAGVAGSNGRTIQYVGSTDTWTFTG